jgi:hypothetical protein
MEIYPKSFQPKLSFVKSIPSPMAKFVQFLSVCRKTGNRHRSAVPARQRILPTRGELQQVTFFTVEAGLEDVYSCGEL